MDKLKINKYNRNVYIIYFNNNHNLLIDYSINKLLLDFI